VAVRARRPGEQVGGYVLLAKLGAGGMGETWLAKRQSIDKKFVIKLMLVELSDHPRAQQYFSSEGDLGSRLHHGNIVNLTDRLTQDGVSYIVFEYVEGVDLEKLLRSVGRVEPAWAVYVAVNVLTALDYVHNATIAGRRGDIVHRDVTPDNVLISAAGEVKLGDWGIAQVTDSIREKTRVPGAIAGKYKYLSPEMARGEPVDHRADLFQVGLLVYECVTGTAAFSGTRAGTESIARCEYRPISSLVSDVPPMLVRAVEALMQSRPEDRPSTAAQAAELLGEACPKFFMARQPLAKTVLTLTNVSMSSTFAVPDAMRAMMVAAINGESPPAGVVVSAGADDRTAIPDAPVRDAPSPKTPFLDEAAIPRSVEAEPSPRLKGRPTRYVRPLPLEGVRKRPPARRWLVPLLVGGVAVAGVAIAVLWRSCGQPRHAPPQALAPVSAEDVAVTPTAPPVQASSVPMPVPPVTPPAAVVAPAAPAPSAVPAPPPASTASKRSKVRKAKVAPTAAVAATAEIIIREETPPLKEVKIDGVSLTAPVRFTVEPGRHEVSITRVLKNGVEMRSRSTVEVAAGEKREVK